MPRRASTRILAPAAVAFVLVGGLIVVIGELRDSGSSTKDRPTAIAGAADAIQHFVQIPQERNGLGKPDAPVTLLEYVDVQCPYCKQFEAAVIPEVIERYVRTGKVRIEMRPIATLGDDSRAGRVAIVAAGRQNRFFEFAHLLFAGSGPQNSGWVTDELLSSIAVSIPGFDLEQFHEDKESESVAAEAFEFDAMGGSDGIRETPSVFVGLTTGDHLDKVELGSATDAGPVMKAIAAALAKSE